MIKIYQMGSGNNSNQNKVININDLNLAIQTTTYYGNNALNSPFTGECLCVVQKLTDTVIKQTCYGVIDYPLYKNYYTRAMSNGVFSQWRINLELSYYDQIETITFAPIMNIDWRITSKKSLTIQNSQDCSLLFTKPLLNTSLQLIINKDTLTPGNIIFPPSVRWPDNVNYTLSQISNIDVLLFIFDGQYYYGSVLENYSK